MLVGQRMTQPVITIQGDMPVQDALNLMRQEHIRRFPVVDAKGGLRGIASERDMLHASASSATSLSVWELNYLISKIKVETVMTSKVITVTEDTPVEEAARMMADNKIGGLPVVREGKVVGIITETDLFKLFLELLGARESGTRLTALVPDVPGELAKLTSAVRDVGGNIIALVTFLGDTTENRTVTLKVGRIDSASLRKAVEPVVQQILDVR
ncbi:MAG: hypothetical protein A2Z37_14380 [Chloroflexi bacterium RBG_19FT_COMBO_62_14]|nr:MAG: hypothetical protein A2Z37_14380 [Chloroflexi bacterium RBG_19FT_COMBO_62_14]